MVNSLELEFGSGSMSPFRELALLPPESQNRQSADIAWKRRSTAQLQTDARPSRGGSERGSGPARKHTVKFEPAAWSWSQIKSQMTSGSGAPKRVFSEDGSNHIQTSTAKLSKVPRLL